MKRFLYFSLFLFMLTGLSFAQVADLAAPSNVSPELQQVYTPFEFNSAVLHDNGPIITLPTGGCSGGAASILDGSTGGHTLYGWGFQKTAFNWIADDFTSTSEWTIDSLKFFSYQSFATTMTITGIYVQIWNGAPNVSGSAVVWGDTVTNRLNRAGLTNIYRTTSAAPTNCDRRIQEIVANVNTTLPAGTYWIQFAATGSAASGPWCPPITIPGVAVTGNALQKTLAAPNWAPALNGLTSVNGAPFIVYGTEAGGVYSFYDNFDSYTAGQKLAAQSGGAWTTWSGATGGGEDAMVSNAFSSTSPNSALITSNVDLVRLHGDLTSGKWYTGFQMYIPTGKAGYFNMLSDFTYNTGGYWAFECYFDAGGGGRLVTENTGTAVTTPFSWAQNTWQWVELVIDLDADQAKFYIGGSLTGTLVRTWPWTSGSSSGTGPKVIDAHDFFGATANDQMYFDNFFIGATSNVPVELTSFGANLNDAGHVVLNWATATETNNQMFEIERSAANGEFFLIGHVKGKGTTTEAQNYSYVDASVTPGKYYYRLRQVDYSGAYEYSNAIEIDVVAPAVFSLGQNYPNPFNPSTQIDFSVAEPSMVKLAVYNLLGQEVQVLRNEFMQAGSYQASFNASDLPSGMYIYKLETANFTQSRKLMLMK
jgi:hypothetical protein